MGVSVCRLAVMTLVLGLGCGDGVRDGFHYGYRNCWRNPEAGECLDYEALFRTEKACLTYMEESLGRRCFNGDVLRGTPEGDAICWKQDQSSSMARGECDTLD